MSILFRGIPVRKNTLYIESRSMVTWMPRGVLCSHTCSTKREVEGEDWQVVSITPVLMFNPGPSLQECGHRPTLTFLHCAQQCCVSPPGEDEIDKDLICRGFTLTCPRAPCSPRQPLKQAPCLSDPLHSKLNIRKLVDLNI